MISVKKVRVSPRRSRFLKLFAVLLFIICLAGAGTCTFLTLYLYNSGYYSASEETLGHNLLNALCADDIYTLRTRFEGLKSEGYFAKETTEQLRSQLYEGFMDGYEESRTNFFFTIHDMADKELLSSYKDDYQCSQVQVYGDTTEEMHTVDLTEEEYEDFIFPANTVRGSEMINSEILNPETTPEAFGFEGYAEDERGKFLWKYDNAGNLYLMRFDEDGMPYIEYRTDDEIIASVTAPVETEHEMVYHVSYATETTENAYYITGYVRDSFQAADKYANVRNVVHVRYQLRYVIPAVAGGCALLGLICLIYLVACAGYHPGVEQAEGSVFEKIPFDVFTAGIVVLGAGFSLLLNEIYFSSRDSAVTAMGFVGTATVIYGLLVLWFMVSTAVRIRTGTIIRQNVCAIVLRWCYIWLKKAQRNVRDFITALPMFWQAAALLTVYLIVHLFSLYLLYESRGELAFGLMIFLDCLAFGVICAVLWNLHILGQGGKKMAEGDLTDKIPEERLISYFRKHAQHLNSLSDGMNKAVEDRLKSEHFRTELIANVSHDLRTPLTSIINYTDLLSKLDLQDAQAKEYIDVLARQSARLRKLTEDVLEASKATTGSLKAVKERMDLRVLIEQIEGEFTERLEAKHLQLIHSISEKPLYILADGRLLWRVMDNLFNNICKYAMDGTRVYLNALSLDGEIIFMLRNISAVQLNISADELMERFVQGDRSRNTEGSGLGLSIAQSLTALQDGRMELQIDGDLFKVTLVFPPAA